MADDAAPGSAPTGRFAKGRSGNPSGRKTGSRNTATLLLDQLADGKASAILKSVMKAAEAGDLRAAELILSRAWPARKGRPVRFDLPPINDAAGVLKAVGAVAKAMAAGDITPEEATAVTGVLEAQRRAIEAHDHDRRLADIEERLGLKGGSR